MDIRHAGLQARDLTAVRRFYAERLGLPVVAETGRHLTVRGGDTDLTFERGDPGARYHVAFAVGGVVEEVTAWLSTRAVSLPGDGEPSVYCEQFDADCVFFTDPLGNLVEFVCPRKNEPTAAGFGPDAVRSVSEIGLPSPDPAAIADGLRQTLRPAELSADGGQVVTPEGRVVGDHAGRLVAVEDGHRWYPIGKPAHPAPVDVVVEGHGTGTWDPDDLPYRVRGV